MHVVLLNQAFYPDVAATAQMSRDLADHLVARGHRVTAVASRSIYGQKGASLPKRETLPSGSGQIEVYRVGSSIFGKTSYAARIADFATFYARATARVLTLDRPDVVISFTTPPFIGLTGLLCRAVRRTKAVYWVMDLYPDVAVACGLMKPHGAATRLLEKLSRCILRRSDVSVVLGRCMRDRVLEKGVPEDRVRLIPVWADTDGISAMPASESPYREAWNLGDDFVVMYSGNFGIGHEAGTVCQAMRLLREERDIRFVFVGGGKRRAEVEQAIAADGHERAHWYDYQPRERLGESLAAADVHLISVREGVEGLIVPSKLFGIMAAGRPSIYIGKPNSEIARVLEETGSGLVVREGDAEGLVSAIRTLRESRKMAAEMGERARAAIEGRFDAATACRDWADLLEHLVGAGKDPSQENYRSASIHRGEVTP